MPDKPLVLTLKEIDKIVNIPYSTLELFDNDHPIEDQDTFNFLKKMYKKMHFEALVRINRRCVLFDEANINHNLTTESYKEILKKMRSLVRYKNHKKICDFLDDRNLYLYNAINDRDFASRQFIKVTGTKDKYVYFDGSEYLDLYVEIKTIAEKYFNNQLKEEQEYRTFLKLYKKYGNPEKKVKNANR